MVGVPDKTRLRRARALVPVVALAATGLSACDDSGEAAGTEPSSSSSPTPSATPTGPGGVPLTEAGAQLGFGEFATVVHPAKGGGTDVLRLRVDSAQRGTLSDLVGFELDDPYKRRGNYYYVRVTVKNAGKKRIASTPVPLWGISGDNTLLRPVQFTSSFKKCPTEPLPQGFKPGATFRTCLVYLSPEHGRLAGVSYRPTAKDMPIEWHGKVAPPPKAGAKPSAEG